MKNCKIHNFKYDDFQIKAIDSIDNNMSLIVSAPTGAGKTAIAEYACWKAMEEGKGIIYTAPVKALSNQKYRDFSAIYGKSKVGILTGDVSIEPLAPILIMTTEIFRNRLFDPEDLYKNRKWVIFDEIHYMDDYERGTVWEESIIFFPQECSLLALSATIPNINELATWISNVHKKTVNVIVETKRPVPLSFNFMVENRFYSGFSKKLKFIFSSKNRKAIPNRFDILLEHLQEIKGFPAIYFIFSRKRCQLLAKECKRFDFATKEEKINLLNAYDNLLKIFNLENDPHAEEMRPFIAQGIAFHHAGILPPLKEIIERLFTSKLIKLIFTTETFALGINMPSKIVIFDSLKKFYGYDFAFLKTRDFYQMAGRAGRRGFDECGSVYSIVSPKSIAFPVLERIMNGEPEPVISQFNSNYATVLNLYKTMGENILNIYPLTFHSFQSGKKLKRRGLFSLKNKLALLKYAGFIDRNGVTERGNFASKIFGYELQASELFIQGFFEDYSEIDIAIMITAMIFEPRKTQRAPHLNKELFELKKIADKISNEMENLQKLFQIEYNTKRFFFHLSYAVKAWMKGVTFEELHNFTDVDEGEIIRNFRMTLQVLREFQRQKNCSDVFYSKIKNCFYLIKRDIMDPEAQFELG